MLWVCENRRTYKISLYYIVIRKNRTLLRRPLGPVSSRSLPGFSIILEVVIGSKCKSEF
jgi:hypothetical protein